jgi:hypothetical protein
MSQRFAHELRQSLPEVDAFIGLGQVAELEAIVQLPLPRIQLRIASDGVAGNIR